MRLKLKIVALSIMVYGISLDLRGQNTFRLPSGYHVFTEYSGSEQRADGDFDGDGVDDLAIVCANRNNEKIIVVYLASQWLINQNYWWFPWDDFYDNKLSFKNDILTISSEDEGGSYNVVLKLKYYDDVNNMKLINYQTITSILAKNADGSTERVRESSKNINLNMGEYQVNDGVKKKIKIATITLADIEKYFEYLNQVGGTN